VGDATAKLINMENYRRRHLFFETGKIDYSWMSAWARRKAEYFEIYKLLGSANFHEACRLISEQWKSFLGLLEGGEGREAGALAESAVAWLSGRIGQSSAYRSSL
jgi:hypothetical protein